MSKKIKSLVFGILTLFAFAFYSNQSTETLSANTIANNSTGNAYTIYNYYNDADLKTQLVAGYAAASQGFLWGMVLGPVGGAVVGLAVGS